MSIIIEELTAKDLQYLEKRLEEARKNIRNSKDKDFVVNFKVLQKTNEKVKKKTA